MNSENTINTQEDLESKMSKIISRIEKLNAQINCTYSRLDELSEIVAAMIRAREEGK